MGSGILGNLFRKWEKLILGCCFGLFIKIVIIGSWGYFLRNWIVMIFVFCFYFMYRMMLGSVFVCICFEFKYINFV